MTCSNWPSVGEIDVMEDVNALSEASRAPCTAAWTPAVPATRRPVRQRASVACSGCQTGFNTYSIIIDRTNTASESISWLPTAPSTTR